MGSLGETEIEMVRRQMRADEEMVDRQRGIVARLPMSGELAEIGRAYLAELEESLAEHHTQLAQLTNSSYSSQAAHTQQDRQEPTIF